MKRTDLTGLIFILLLSVSFSLQAQCNMQSTEQGEGNVTYYLNPELIADDSQFGIALSVQSVSDKYYLALTYKFSGMAQALEEKVSIELTSGYTLDLDMYTMEVGNAGGIELCMAVYNLESEVIPYFRASDMKTIHFKSQDGKAYDIPVNHNADALKRQLRCFGL